MALAEKQLEGSERTGELVLFTAFMVVGGVGAGYGALQSPDTDHVGTSAAAGAIGTEIAGLIYGIVQIRKEARRREREREALVDDCQREEGYNPRGWE